MKKHAGANLDGYVASELRLGWRVGRIQVCGQHVIVVVRILSTSKPELRAFRARSRHPACDEE